MHDTHDPIPQDNHALALALLKLDNYTFDHSYRVHQLALLIGEELRLTAGELQDLATGALFHDIGKVKIKRTILNKTTTLTTQEWRLIKTHPEIGYELVKEANMSQAVQHIVLYHHRWLNSQGGYPLNPACPSDCVPCLLTQIVTVSDVVDAMTSQRPYRDAIKLDICLQYLLKNSNKIFRKQVVDKVLKLKNTGVLKEVMNIS